MVRLAHLSDIHIDSTQLDWRREDWFNKRLTTWFNYRVLGRRRRFADAANILTCLMDQLSGRAIDHLVFSGDATAMGFPSEIRRAAELLHVRDLPIPGLAVPGNHDYCTRSAAASGDFERAFAPWQQGERIDTQCYPFAQRVGSLWLIGVNAAQGNRLAWDASGRVGQDQLLRLRQLLTRLGKGLKILVIHYPLRLANGELEPAYHGLRDLQELLDVAQSGGIDLWLHGHRHSPYCLSTVPGVSFPAICAGTATQQGIGSYSEYTIDGASLQAVRRAYDPAAHCFREVETFSLALRTLS